MVHLACPRCGNVYPVREIDPAKTYRCLVCSEILAAQSGASTVRLPVIKPGVSLLVPGSSFGHFVIVRECGRGGMGSVYEAKDLETGRRVALKILRQGPGAETEESAREAIRFLKETQLCASIPPHPNVVRVLQGGVVDGTFYVAMEFVDGRPLHEWRRDAEVTLRNEVAILRDVALAVHHHHLHGVVHRDLKPENLLVDADGRPHVTDFGLARIVGVSKGDDSTKSNELVGTAPYVSPEQVLKPKSVDFRTDIYAIGVMLYEALTGFVPFRGKSGIAMIMSVVHDPVTPPRQTPRGKALPDIDAEIERICMKSMSRKATDRHESAKTLAHDLTRWLK